MSPFLFNFILGIVAIKAQQQMKLHLLSTNETGGQCLDGSQAGFYYSPPPSGSSNLWVIYLHGGGACHDEQTCMKRANTSMGSSKHWSETYTAGGVNSNVETKNPDFYQGHQVFGRYCTSDVWSGTRITPSTNPDTWGLYFSGHNVFKRIIDYLAYDLPDSLLDAEYILLAGGSAGALGTFGNINWLYTEMKTNMKLNVTIKAAPTAGWFFPGNTTDQLSDPMMPPNDYPHWIQGENGGCGHNNSINILYDSYVDPGCAAALGPNNSWNCGSVHNFFPYILAPVFVLENKYDSNQIDSEMLMPTNVVNNQTISYVEYYGNDMDRSIIPQLVDQQNPQHGLFYASCYQHANLIVTNGKVKINGYTPKDTVGDWFWERNKVPHVIYDTCNDQNNKLPCNPTCDGYPPPPKN